MTVFLSVASFKNIKKMDGQKMHVKQLNAAVQRIIKIKIEDCEKAKKTKN